MDNSRKAKQTIENICFITLATSSKTAQPWNTPLYSVHNKKLVFYWASSPKSIHSTNISKNSKVSIIIYDSKAKVGFGVYIKAKAKMVKNEAEIERAFKLFRKSKFLTSTDDLKGSSPLRLYKAIPEKFWVNDITKVNGRYVDIRKEVKLN